MNVEHVVSLALASTLVIASGAGSAMTQPAASADAVVASAAPGASLTARAHGLFEDGGLLGGGPDFKVRFEPGRVEFTPALGDRVPRNQPLSFELLAIERGDVELAVGGAAAPRRRDPCVEYERGGALERYEVTAAGIQQSFVFAERPAGAGELAVRGRIETPLPCAGYADDGALRFEIPGVGGVRYGGVTGIDAAGRRAAGELRFDGAEIELALPGWFVDQASYPLVLDPAIGAAFPVAVGPYADRAPDVAFDASTGRYAFVWERRFSELDGDIRAALYSSTGVPFAPLIGIESSAWVQATHPAIGNCNTTDSFLCVWEEVPIGGGGPIVADIRGRRLTATGLTSAGAVTIDSSASWCSQPDVGGEAGVVEGQVIVVWKQLGDGIVGRQVSVPAAFNPFLVNPVFPISAAHENVDEPSISKSGGVPGWYLVVWTEYQGTSLDYDVRARAVSRNGLTLKGILDVSTEHVWETNPDVDGDGSTFLIVYSSATLGPGAADIRAHTATVSSVDPIELVLDGDAHDDAVDPVVGRTGNGYVVAWEDLTVYPFHDLHARSFTLAGAPSEPVTVLAVGTAWDPYASRQASVATQRSGGGAGSEAMLTWDDHPHPGQDIFALRWRTELPEGGGPGPGHD